MLDAPANENEKIASRKDASDFISFILTRPNKLETLIRLSTSRFGLKVLQNSLSHDHSITFVQNQVVSLIDFVARDESLAFGISRSKFHFCS